MAEIRKVAVLGAGLMGSGIAAQIANAGVPVLLLDMPAKSGDDRNAVANGAVDKLLKTEPAAFMHKDAAKLVETGNFEDHLARLAEVDWIVEAIIENLDIKRGLYAKVDAARKPGSVVSSNTSTIPLKLLIEGQSEAFQRDFCITHFFNPPRYMRLLEVVRGPKTRADAVEAVSRFGDVALGKGVVVCNDTPGFIANRIGTYFMQCAVTESLDAGLTVEEVDAALGKPIGVPKTGVYGLMDLVGLDLMPLIGKSLKANLPASDDYNRIFRAPALFEKMIADGYIGRKGKGGFYRMQKDAAGKRQTQAIDLQSGEYRAANKAEPSVLAQTKGDLKALVESDDKLGRFVRRVLAQSLAYTASLVPEIADDVVAVDEAMRLGYNWKWGPFELIDKLGAEWLAKAVAEVGLPVPALVERAKGRSFYRVENGRLEYLTTDGAYQPVQRADGVLLLADIKRGAKPVLKNGSASVWDIGDGVLCFEFTSKMNSLDEEILTLLQKTCELVKSSYKALVIYNEGQNFSVGANLGVALFAANIAAWPQIEASVATGQDVLKRMKYARFPVVGAPSGMALGGGCEILLHCDAVQAHAESYIGLVEVGVGLVPGWGGNKELLGRWLTLKRRPGGPIPALAKAFETISTAKVSRSAADAKELLFLRATDGVTMNRDRLLADAKAKALAMAENYQPPQPIEYRLPGPTGKASVAMVLDGFVRTGKATKHDEVVSMALADVLSGGKADVTEITTEDKLLDLERQAFMTLIKTPATLARIEHMLETGKPLRN